MEPLALAVEHHAPHEQRDDLKRVPLADHLVDPELNVVAVEHRRALLKLRKLVGDRLALRHQLVQLRGNRVCRARLRGEIHHARLLALVVRETLAQRVHGVEVVGQRGLLLLQHEIGDDARHVIGFEERAHLLGDRALQLLLRHDVSRGGASVVRVLPAALAVPAAALVAVSVHVEQLSGKQVLHGAPPLPRTQRKPALHAVEQLAVHDGGHAVLDPRAAVLVDARVLLVAQHLRDRAHVERLARERAPRPQGIHYLGEAAAGVVHLEHGAHHARLLLVDVVEAIAAEVEAVYPHAIVLALEGVAVQPALHILR
ncbi:hypothetical protein B5F23_08230 [Olsenella sp. An188]|uniref:hypothetical protein n=1 Tax=Olsenella sp. An188 TaxID=1965579 RepID=UPI000B38758C|nr:hypothetical protein [Olsenella sp. An188]OUP37934.1 hypothetical protein B5F23_08230 [Olsenella sp. An188]